jgi:hypothetical protein
MKKTCTPWIGIPPKFIPLDWAGFVYLIVHVPSQRKYIGKKFLASKTRKRVKGKKRRKLCVKESDWAVYKSSSTDLKADIAKYGIDSFTFEILSIHKTRAQVNYEEVRQQFLRDVLYSRLDSGEFAYYNTCIGAHYYRKRT